MFYSQQRLPRSAMQRAAMPVPSPGDYTSTAPYYGGGERCSDAKGGGKKKKSSQRCKFLSRKLKIRADPAGGKRSFSEFNFQPACSLYPVRKYTCTCVYVAVFGHTL